MDTIQEEHIVEIHASHEELVNSTQPEFEKDCHFENPSMQADKNSISVEVTMKHNKDIGETSFSNKTVTHHSYIGNSSYDNMPNELPRYLDREFTPMEKQILAQFPNYEHMLKTSQKYAVQGNKKSPDKKARKACGLCIMIAVFMFVTVSILLVYYVRPMNRNDQDEETNHSQIISDSSTTVLSTTLLDIVFTSQGLDHHISMTTVSIESQTETGV